jgi:hypothetical protein
MGTPRHKNDIISIKKKIDDYTSESRANTTCFFLEIFSLVNVYAKNGRGQGETLLDPNVAVNFFRLALNVFKLGNNIFIQSYCNNPQLERNFYLF